MEKKCAVRDSFAHFSARAPSVALLLLICIVVSGGGWVGPESGSRKNAGGMADESAELGDQTDRRLCNVAIDMMSNLHGWMFKARKNAG